MKVLVCGSRTFIDQALVTRVLDGIDLHESIDCLIHGAARGADDCGATWAKVVHTEAHAYTADWARHGKSAGYLRNVLMLNDGQPDLVVAFIDKPLAESKGTAMMVDLSRKAGVKTIVVEATP